MPSTAAPAPTGSAPGTVLITGAGAGIGRAAALRFARAGWHTVLVDNHAQAMQRLQPELLAAGAQAVTTHALDLTDAGQIETLSTALPPLDALINNAGMSHAGASALAPLHEELPARLLALNLAAPARMVQACAAQLRPGARVVNLASGAALRAIPWRGLYSPSKAGLVEQTRALAQTRPDWTVTALAPGFVRTELVQQLLDTGRLDPARALAKVPLGRMAEPWELAEALYFLASESARALHGQTLSVCGGSSVYGGSQALPLAEHPCLNADTPLSLHVHPDASGAWSPQALAQALAHTTPHAGPVPGANGAHYAAVLDASPLDAPPGGQLEAVQAAAARFEQHHPHTASLTLVLPVRSTAWHHAGDAAAARMLVSTVAVEWGSRGLRLNALEVDHLVAPAACAPLARYLSGAGAQYLTGQTLRLTPHASGDRHDA